MKKPIKLSFTSEYPRKFILRVDIGRETRIFPVFFDESENHPMTAERILELMPKVCEMATEAIKELTDEIPLPSNN